MAITSAPTAPCDYLVWIASKVEPPQAGLAWEHYFTHSDQLNPQGARRAAQAHASTLRRCNPELYVAVRPAGSCPPPLGSQVLRD